MIIKMTSNRCSLHDGNSAAIVEWHRLGERPAGLLARKNDNVDDDVTIYKFSQYQQENFWKF